MTKCNLAQIGNSCKVSEYNNSLYIIILRIPEFSYWFSVPLVIVNLMSVRQAS